MKKVAIASGLAGAGFGMLSWRVSFMNRGAGMVPSSPSSSSLYVNNAAATSLYFFRDPPDTCTNLSPHSLNFDDAHRIYEWGVVSILGWSSLL